MALMNLVGQGHHFGSGYFSIIFQIMGAIIQPFARHKMPGDAGPFFVDHHL
jgi:hypothetical protein